MEQTGYVTDVKNKKVYVRVDRESSCGGNCVSCKGCPTSAVIVECTSHDSLKPGDTVRLVMPTKSFFVNLFWGYGQMIVLAIIGAVVSYNIFKTEISSVLGLAVGIACGLGISKLIFKKKKTEVVAVIDKG